MSVPLSPHPLQHMLLPVVLILAILIGAMWNLRVVLICISLINKDFDHFFRCFSTIHASSILKCQFSSISHFLTGFFGFLVISFLSALHNLDISTLSEMRLVKIFFLICRLLICLIDNCLIYPLPYTSFPVS